MPWNVTYHFRSLWSTLMVWNTSVLIAYCSEPSWKCIELRYLFGGDKNLGAFVSIYPRENRRNILWRENEFTLVQLETYKTCRVWKFKLIFFYGILKRRHEYYNRFWLDITDSNTFDCKKKNRSPYSKRPLQVLQTIVTSVSKRLTY